MSSVGTVFFAIMAAIAVLSAFGGIASRTPIRAAMCLLAHIISLAPVKPRQRLRISLKDGDRPLTGVAVWVHFELPEEGPRYRAGIEFGPSASSAVADYISERTR